MNTSVNVVCRTLQRIDVGKASKDVCILCTMEGETSRDAKEANNNSNNGCAGTIRTTWTRAAGRIRLTAVRAWRAILSA